MRSRDIRAPLWQLRLHAQVGLCGTADGSQKPPPAAARACASVSSLVDYKLGGAVFLVKLMGEGGGTKLMGG